MRKVYRFVRIWWPDILGVTAVIMSGIVLWLALE